MGTGLTSHPRQRAGGPPQRPTEPPPQLLPQPHLLRCCTPRPPAAQDPASCLLLLPHWPGAPRALASCGGRAGAGAGTLHVLGSSKPSPAQTPSPRYGQGSTRRLPAFAAGGHLGLTSSLTGRGPWLAAGGSQPLGCKPASWCSGGRPGEQTDIGSSPGLTPTDPMCLSRQPQGLGYPCCFLPR